MFNRDKILAIIPARGGSKGIKDKNIYPVCGKPLVAHTIEAAKESRYIDYVLVSTDSEKIADVAKESGAEVPFLRPEELASDTSKTIDAILYTIGQLNKLGKSYETLILLQPTSPLRTSEDIDAAIELFYAEGKKSLLSVSEVSENPVLIRRMQGNVVIPILSGTSTVRRQDFEKYYRVNGAIYINAISEVDESTSFNDNEIGFVMDVSHSVDIDTMEDVKKAEALK